MTKRSRMVRRLRLVARASWESAGPRFLLMGVGYPLSASAGVATAALLRALIDAVAQGERSKAIAVGVLLATLDAGAFVVARVVNRAATTVQECTRHWFDRELVRIAASVPTLEHYELPEYLDELEAIRRQPAPLAQTVLVLLNLGSLTVQLVLMGIVLADVDPRLLTLPALAIPLVVAVVRGNETFHQAWTAAAVDWRAGQDAFDVATSRTASAEVRIQRLTPELLARHHDASARADTTLNVAARRAALYSIAGSTIAVAAYGTAIAVVSSRALRGTATVGDVVLTVALAALVSRQIVMATEMLTRFTNSMRLLDRFVWLEDFSATRARVGSAVAVPAGLVHGIELREVSFSYNEGASPALRDIDLSLPAGNVVAIVGENGAGKTTLVKLLTGMYRPTTGAILVDDLDLSEMDPEEWRRATSAAFQDFARFEFVAGEVVGVGDLPAVDDQRAIEGALASAGAVDVIAHLDQGLATELGASFPQGRDLSGGQWQKLALGRAMMRVAPLLLVLDEPTASLDALAERALFERYASHARSVAGATGTIVVLISHRFSTVSMADLIVVLDGGAVREVGTHAQLRRDGGLYAELYELQAAGYR